MISANPGQSLRDIFLSLSNLCFVLVVVTACSITPRHDIRPKPEFIRAGVQAGDTVEIVTLEGSAVTLTVTDVRGGEIRGETPSGNARVVDFAEIASIAKRSWDPPAHPCGGGQPVGCSIPEVVLAVSDDYQRQAEKFRGACVTHDFCYRHGFATYGLDRATCDDEFYADMKASCQTLGPLSFLDPKEYAMCQAAAAQTFEAVRRYGEAHFLTTASTVCEYR